MSAFGPVPSRRLGRSVGINNIPAKTCTYSCIYCQLGRTATMAHDRRAFFEPERVFAETRKQVERARSHNERIDYLTFVPDGEPTLDLNLQREVELLRRLDLPIAILTNSSLLWQEEVRDALEGIDLVSLKVDAVSESLWRRIDRPHGLLRLERILEGIGEFVDEFEGRVIIETMLVDDLDYSDEIENIAAFLGKLDVDRAYIAIPTRPPAEEWVMPAREDVLNHAFCSFSEKLGAERVEILMGYEGNEFSCSGNLEQDLLSITSVHPMREDAVRDLVERANATWDSVTQLLQRREIVELRYRGATYYMRRIPSRRG